MSRFSLALVAVALAVGVVGCTHCDTCDDFPIPNVGMNTYPVTPGAPYDGPPMGEASMIVPPPPQNVPGAAGVPTELAPAGPPASGAFTPGTAPAPKPAVRPSDTNSPPPPTSLGDQPKG